MLYLLINPLCQCTETYLDTTCKSFWRKFSGISLENASCYKLRRVTIREHAISIFQANLNHIKELSCNIKIHNWEPNPNNSNMIRCQTCTKGAKRLEFCPCMCNIHNKMCLNEYMKFSVCRDHSCISCKVPEISTYVTIINLILAECSNYTLFPRVQLTFKNKK